MRHWHQCQRWWESGLPCPFEKGNQHEEIRQPDDDYDEVAKVPRVNPPKLIVPPGKKEGGAAAPPSEGAYRKFQEPFLP